MERLIDPIKQTCLFKIKSNSVKQEFEKQDELKRSALRAVIALQNLPGADKNQQLNDFVSYIKSDNDLSAFYASVQKDGHSLWSGGSAGDSSMKL